MKVVAELAALYERRSIKPLTPVRRYGSSFLWHKSRSATRTGSVRSTFDGSLCEVYEDIIGNGEEDMFVNCGHVSAVSAVALARK